MSSLKDTRPLSPHLSIYRPQLTTVLSISHRISGIFLTLGLFLYSGWLITAAYSPENYEEYLSVASSFPGQLILFLFTFALYWHLAMGIRHLLWDVGYGFEIKTAYRSGYIAVLSAIGLTILTWITI